MAKIDRFLATMVQKGAPILRLDPGDPPLLEFAGGHRQILPGSELLGTVLDGLAKELLPPDQETAYLRGEKVSVDHSFEQERFQLIFLRSTLGTRILVGRAGASGGPAGTASTGGRLDGLLRRLLRAGGSDLYLNSEECPVLRLDGRLEVLEDTGTLSANDLEEMVKPWAPAPCMEAFQGGQDTEFSHAEPELHCRQRVSLFHDATGPSAAIRVIPDTLPDAATLGLSEEVQRLACLKHGLVLLTGASGSGRSTTMASLLDRANRHRQDYIIAIQDAIEFTYPKGSCLLRQREVGRDVPRHRQAIRAALAQAPDILALGELRDPSLVELALQAAQSGCMVLATLGTLSLVDTLYTLQDAFPLERQGWARNRLSECLKAVVGHTLLRRPGGGRAAALETFFSNPALAALIRAGRFEELPAATKGGRYGQVGHTEALLQLIRRGEVEPQEAYLKCQDREAFIAACKEAGFAFDPRCEGQKITEA